MTCHFYNLFSKFSRTIPIILRVAFFCFTLLFFSFCKGQGISEKIKNEIEIYLSQNKHAPNDLEFFSLIAPYYDDLSPEELKLLFIFLVEKQQPLISKQGLLSLYLGKIASIKNISVAFQERSVQFDDNGKAISEEVIDCVHNISMGKIHVEYTEILNVTDHEPFHFTETYDDNIVISVNFQRDGIPNAHIAKLVSLSNFFLSEGPLYPAGLLNENILKLANFSGMGLVTSLKQMGGVFENKTIIHGSECILVADGSSRYYLDTSKDFSIVKIEEWISESNNSLPKLVMDANIEMNDYLNCGNGIWIPQKVITTGYKDGKIEAQKTILVSSVEINKPISEEIFSKPIPNDAFVVDDIRGICYFYENAPSIDKLLKKTVKSKRVFIYRYISIISGLVLIFIVLVIKYRLYLKDKRERENKTDEETK
jgi:hypothetical protein